MKLRICTFNIRLDCAVDGVNAFPNRVPLIVETLKKELPDVIGFQEMTPAMREVLSEKLTEYCFVGGGREKDRSGESSAIAFLREKFILCECETRWLSFTPTVPGSRYGLDQSSCPRVFTSAVLTGKHGGKPFRVLNVHTDHIGERARLLSTGAMLAYISEKRLVEDMPVFVTGDFNASPDSPEMAAMRSYEGMRDFTEGVGTTFHGYGKCPDHPQIDYIFHLGGYSPIYVRKCDVRRGELYISDHFPVICEVTDEGTVSV